MTLLHLGFGYSLVLKMVHIYSTYMNNHLKHVVCFTHSKNSLYLTKIPELSASWWMFIRQRSARPSLQFSVRTFEKWIYLL